MYSVLEDRFEPINYKSVSLIKGEYVESDEVNVFTGYITSSFEHLVSAGEDVTKVKATIITNKHNADLIKQKYLVEVDGVYYTVTKIKKYSHPYGKEYDTYEVFI